MKDDAFGRAVLDWVNGGTEPEIFERDDGYVETGAGPEIYLAHFEDWRPQERRAMRYVGGRVVDVGCGAGRVGLHLQDRGFDVRSIDVSPLALRACRARGLRRVSMMSLDELTERVHRFDTAILLGNNFGLLGSPERAREVLTDWAGRMPEGARIMAQSMDPRRGAQVIDAAVMRRNRELGRAAGQVRLRVRYRDLTTPWFDWLFVSRLEMTRIVRGTGWAIRKFLGPRRHGEPFVAILELRPRPERDPRAGKTAAGSASRQRPG